MEIYINPDNVRTMSAQHLTKDICLTREILCGHSAEIYLQGYISALYPSWVFKNLEKKGSDSAKLELRCRCFDDYS